MAGSRTMFPNIPLRAALPHVFVADMARATDFYRDVLGFEVAVSWGTPPFYVEMARDEARLALRRVEGPVFVGDIRERESLLAVSLPVATRAGIEAISAGLAAAGVALHQPLTDQPWGARDLIVRDPDGNLVHVSGPSRLP